MLVLVSLHEQALQVMESLQDRRNGASSNGADQGQLLNSARAQGQIRTCSRITGDGEGF